MCFKCEPEAVGAYIRDSQVHHWDRFEKSLERALNGAWSIEAEADAIMALRAALLGEPLGFGEVSWKLEAGGIVGRLYEIVGIPYAITEAEWVAAERTMTGYQAGWDRHHFAVYHNRTLRELERPGTAARIREECGL